ncbi:precursor of CEP14 [Rhodamnia argentea]|uniref:Precursor of CEP14 n=1 Tax=Rhodamnia argentea TaxID=178133 RepID=A0A8B8QPR5_9MYRT|nr:precursor of CEP14 [Rhodamnia argentea]
MGRSSTIALVFIAVVLASSMPCFEGRMLWERTSNLHHDGNKRPPLPSPGLYLTALPKGTIPASTPSKKGHAEVVDEKLIARHLGSLDRVLIWSVPSPGVGH